MKYNGHTYDCTVCGDLVRDGLYIEVRIGSLDILEIFYSDASGEMTVSFFEPDVPLPVVEWAISIARQRLPPASELIKE
jgi:hypothetical protein